MDHPQHLTTQIKIMERRFDAEIGAICYAIPPCAAFLVWWLRWTVTRLNSLVQRCSIPTINDFTGMARLLADLEALQQPKCR
jgi:hypothetical protein